MVETATSNDIKNSQVLLDKLGKLMKDEQAKIAAENKKERWNDADLKTLPEAIRPFRRKFHATNAMVAKLTRELRTIKPAVTPRKTALDLHKRIVAAQKDVASLPKLKAEAHKASTANALTEPDLKAVQQLLKKIAGDLAKIPKGATGGLAGSLADFEEDVDGWTVGRTSKAEFLDLQKRLTELEKKVQAAQATPTDGGGGKVAAADKKFVQGVVDEVKQELDALQKLSQPGDKVYGALAQQFKVLLADIEAWKPSDTDRSEFLDLRKRLTVIGQKIEKDTETKQKQAKAAAAPRGGSANMENIKKAFAELGQEFGAFRKAWGANDPDVVAITREAQALRKEFGGWKADQLEQSDFLDMRKRVTVLGQKIEKATERKKKAAK